jgi:hypothetical protein
MERRDFFGFTAMIGGGMLLSACNDGEAAPAATPTQTKPTGAVTLVYEIRVAGPTANTTVQTNITSLKSTMNGKTGYLGLSFKKMTGESTMVKNYPNNLKGVLNNGFIGNAKVPSFYSLFIRFDSYDNMIASGSQKWFIDNIVPSLFAYNAATSSYTTIALDYYEGVYVTVAAGNRTSIYTTQTDIVNFLKNQSDEITVPRVTVQNHVMIKNANLTDFNTKIQVLLTTAQQTYMPNDGSGNGIAAIENTGLVADTTDTNYRKAVTTEILQNAFTDGDLRSYIMHGVWESVGDHENSHIDIRFQQASGPVGAYVVVGPVEPFYSTIAQDGVAAPVA